jgi:hypothetical protein
VDADLVRFLESKAVLYYGELTRVDSKTNTILGLSSGGLALLVVFATGTSPLPVASRVLVASAVLSLSLAILVLLRLLRPRRTLTRPVYEVARSGPADFHASMRALSSAGPTEWRSADVQDLATLVLRRMRELSLATDLLVLTILLVLPVPLIGLFA